MIRQTINKLNNLNSIKNRKVYITDRTLSYTIVADIQNNKIHIITIITEKGVIAITGRNPAIKIVS
jgi:predicted methyltransferase